MVTLLAAVWSWWAWRDGGYFETVWLPALVLLCAAAAMLLLIVPSTTARPRGPTLVALLALAALGGWSLTSALWSPAPETAVADGQRILMYALAFGIGAWIGRGLGTRAIFALVPLAAAGAVGTAVAVIDMLTTESPDELLINGTLDDPIGYRNANAAFFIIAFFPALGLAASRDVDWRARGPALAAATGCLGLAMLSQSRASVPAAAIAVAVYVLLSPLRVRAISWLMLAVLPALGVLPALFDLYDAATAEPELRGRTLDELEGAGLAIIGTAAIALVLGGLAARFDRSLPGLGSDTPRANRAIAAALAALVLAGGTGFVAVSGDPIDWVEDRVDEFRYAGTPTAEGRASRFTFNAGSNRYDLWRVALDDAASEPVLGEGGGGFQYSYLRQRDVDSQEARDAHSVELEVLSELGVPGLTLLLVTLTASVLAITRARRTGGVAATVSATALASGAYWLAHGSLDWFWTYAGVTAPTMALLGAAAASGIRRAEVIPRAIGRGVVALVLVVIALSAVPPFLSARYTDGAFDGWRNDLDRAYDDLDRAADLNRLSDLPLLAEGAIARAAGDRKRAIAAFESAVELKPEEFAGHYLLAQLQARSRPSAARAEAAAALELNPLDPQVRLLARRLGLHAPELD